MDVTMVDALQLGFGFTTGAIAALLVALPILAFLSAFCWSLARGIWNGVRGAVETQRASNR